uniref:P2X purinoreceptor 7 intracellular domain-containing protein n=1 Tax=Cyprinus carpio TaxID=7962 RepID=A0A8C2IRS5_CYPCA
PDRIFNLSGSRYIWQSDDDEDYTPVSSQTQPSQSNLSFEQLRSFTNDILQWQPGLVFDVLALRQNNAPPPSAGLPGMPWCTCQNCRDMPTDRERKCCRQTPNNCISNLPLFRDYCLDGGFLRIHRQYREDVTALGRAREPGSESREFRYAAYRHYIYWQHGSLGVGNRLVIPSCCVCKIRDTFPDPQGQYTGFLPGF